MPDPSQFGVSRSDAYLMLETEFALTPANLQVFARVGNGRVSIKQGNNFAFNGVDRIDFEDADSTLHFFFPEDVAYALADSANRINVTRVFSSQRGKDYVLVGVPFGWIDSAPKGTLIETYFCLAGGRWRCVEKNPKAQSALKLSRNCQKHRRKRVEKNPKARSALKLSKWQRAIGKRAKAQGLARIAVRVFFAPCSLPIACPCTHGNIRQLSCA